MHQRIRVILADEGTYVFGFCQYCGTPHSFLLGKEFFPKLRDLARHQVNLIDFCDDLTPHEREFLKSGVCPDCQKSVMGFSGNIPFDASKWDRVPASHIIHDLKVIDMVCGEDPF